MNLKRGRNDVLVEVVNVGGGWGFYLRFNEQGGAALYLSEDGTIPAAQG